MFKAKYATEDEKEGDLWRDQQQKKEARRQELEVERQETAKIDSRLSAFECPMSQPVACAEYQGLDDSKKGRVGLGKEREPGRREQGLGAGVCAAVVLTQPTFKLCASARKSESLTSSLLMCRSQVEKHFAELQRQL